MGCKFEIIAIKGTVEPKPLLLVEKPLRFQTVPLDVINARRNVCQTCEYSTKDPDPKFKPWNGLTNKSICLRVEAKHPGRSNIAEGTKRADVTCKFWEQADGNK